MGDLDRLTPANRIPPTRPVPGSGTSNQAPQRKPATGDDHHQQQQRRRRKPDADDVPHIDEYA